jgi:hypothetical protein
MDGVRPEGEARVSTNWSEVRQCLDRILDQNGPEVFHDPSMLGLLVDMRDLDAVEFQQLRTQFARRRATTALDRAMKAHKYQAPAAARASAADRVWVELAYDRRAVVDNLIPHLVAHPDVYVQGNDLVRIVGVKDGTVAPSVQRLSAAQVAEVVTSAVVLFAYRGGADEEPERIPVQPDRHLLEMILGRRDYPGARTIEGISEAPLVRHDGSVFAEAGYDPQTRYFCTYRGPTLEVPDDPSIDDARRALAALTDLVEDFPFKGDVHRSVWLAAVFTLILRPHIEGPTPIIVVSANHPGTGKTMLVEIVSLIVYGRPATRRPFTDDDRELTASVTAILAQGVPMALFDNVDRPFGGAFVDLVATSRDVSTRLYGRNDQSLALRANTVFFATGNNVALRGDLVRRVLFCELQRQLENPEARTGFRHPDLLSTVKNTAATVLAAAMTVVRAFLRAGSPRAAVRPFGSYEEWSRWVRNLLLWVGAADPVASQEELRLERDTPLAGLLAAWMTVFGENVPATIHEALTRIREAESDRVTLRRDGPVSFGEYQEVESRAAKTERLKAALMELGMQSVDRVSTVTLGRKLKTYAHRNCQGLRFESVLKDNTHAWKVVRVPPSEEGAK